ncbi:MAG: ROK family protein [Ignavibacterium sp.]
MPKNEKYAIGVDLGGTFIKFGIVSNTGKILQKISLETKADDGPKVVIKQIKKGIKELISKNKIKIRGIGIGAPGVVSIKKGTVENPPNIPGWGKIHLGKIIQDEFGIFTYVENDANAAAVGEMIFGSGKSLDSFVMITLGTGVGGGIILNNKLFRGETGGAGEIGHITINYNGLKCNCGSYGCIETFVGNQYLIERVKKELTNNVNSKIFDLLNYNLDELSPKIISEAAKLNDEFSINKIKEVGEFIGYALASVGNLLDVTNFIIGGGVSGLGPILLQSIEKKTKERILKSLSPRVKIFPAKLKNDAGIQGASSLIFYNQ